MLVCALLVLFVVVQDLREGLQSLIAGEMVDYTWESEDGKKERLETTKRASIKVLPKHLIVHLKRFEYDFDTDQQVKLNDRFEFPRELDMYVTGGNHAVSLYLNALASFLCCFVASLLRCFVASLLGF